MSKVKFVMNVFNNYTDKFPSKQQTSILFDLVKLRSTAFRISHLTKSCNNGPQNTNYFEYAGVCNSITKSQQ